MISDDDKKWLEEADRKVLANKQRIKRLQTFQAGAEDEFWLALKEELELAIKTEEWEREGILSRIGLIGKSAEEDLIAAKAHTMQVRAYRAIVSNVEKAAQRIDHINLETAKIVHKVKELRGMAPTERTSSKRRQNV